MIGLRLAGALGLAPDFIVGTNTLLGGLVATLVTAIILLTFATLLGLVVGSIIPFRNSSDQR